MSEGRREAQELKIFFSTDGNDTEERKERPRDNKKKKECRNDGKIERKKMKELRMEEQK